MGRVGAGAVRDSNVPAVSTERMSGELIFVFHGTARYKGWVGGRRARERGVMSAEKACRSTDCQMSSPDLFQRKTFIGEYGVKKHRL